MSSISGSSSSSSYLRELQQELEAELKNARQKSDENEDRTEKRVSELKQKYENETRQTVDEIRRNQDQSATRERENTRAELKRVQQEGYDRRGRNLADPDSELSRMSEKVRQSQLEARDRSDKAVAQAETRAEKAARDAQERNEKDTRLLLDSHAAEQAELRDTVKKALDLEKYYQQQKADGRRQGYAEVENDFRKDREVLEKQFQAEVNGLRERAARKTESDSARQTTWAKEKDQEHAERLRTREAEHRSAELDLARQYENSVDQIESRKNHSVDNLEEQFDLQRKDLTSAFEKAHRDQAKSYEEHLKSSREESEEEIRELGDKVHESKVTSDPKKVSPAAYDRIRDSALREAEKTQAQQEARYQNKFDSLREQSKHTYGSRAREHVQDVTRLNREKSAVETHAQSQLNMLATESEERITETRIGKEREVARTLEANDKLHSREIESLRHKYEEILEGVKNDAADKMLLLREQGEFQNRMIRRAFSAQQNELIREYEKRLEDAKADSTELLKKTQDEAQKTIKELEDKRRGEFEKQSRLSDYRIAQLEQQYQNRERVIARNYQEELEKLKRANAQLQSKKS